MNAEFFSKNRRALATKLDGGLVVLSAYTHMQHSADMAARFEQESNFWYVTGIEHADWQVIIDTAREKEWLVKPDIKDMHEIFDGSLSVEQAMKTSGIRQVISVADRDVLLRELARKHSVVYTVEQPDYVQRANFAPNPALTANKRHLETIFSAVQTCNKELAQLRAIKQPQEIAAIKKAISLTTKAFAQIKETLQTYTHEYQVEADFTHYFRSRGATGHAYDPIVAVGKNACTLHYGENNSRLRQHQLLLLDVGARLDGYAADISRTYAIGTPTDRQQTIHVAIQKAHKDIVKIIRPGLSVQDYSEAVDMRMKQALIEVGLLHDTKDDETYRTYFPHAISHGLGIDVHDSLGGPKTFESGMVLTVEPGVYISEENLGLRIEDNILVTETGHTNMSGSLSTEL